MHFFKLKFIRYGVILLIFLFVSSLTWYIKSGQFLSEKPSIGFVDQKRIINEGGYFQRAREEWEEDQKELSKNYKNQLDSIRRKLSQQFISLENLASEKVRNLSNHKHSSNSRFSESIASGISRKNREKIKTFITRKRRAKEIIESKRREIRRRGLGIIKKAVEEAALKNNVDLVYTDGQVIFRNKKISEDVTFPDEIFENLTTDVIRALNQ